MKGSIPMLAMFMVPVLLATGSHDIAGPDVVILVLLAFLPLIISGVMIATKKQGDCNDEKKR